MVRVHDVLAMKRVAKWLTLWCVAGRTRSDRISAPPQQSDTYTPPEIAQRMISGACQKATADWERCSSSVSWQELHRIWSPIGHHRHI